MKKGSFEGLYTFVEASRMCGVDDSCFRKKVAHGRLKVGVDVKKMGATWIITEDAMSRVLGKKSKRSRCSKKSYSMNHKEDKVKDSWVSGEIKGVEHKSFSFNTSD